MYIVKNALRSISRSKGRNILIGIIVLVIAVSTCVSLSIRQAAEKAKAGGKDLLNITAQISIDRQSLMQNAAPQQGTQPDRDSMRELFQSGGELTLEQLKSYAAASSVGSFYYTLTSSLNGGEGIEAVTSSSQTGSSGTAGESPQNKDFPAGGGGGKTGSQGDFTLVGYSGDDAMTSFTDGTCSVSLGAMFTESTDMPQCIISDELATFNSLSVGDTLCLVNPNDETQSTTLTITGIYHNSQSTVAQGGKMGGFMAASDPANQIYLSYNALTAIAEQMQGSAATADGETSDTQSDTAVRTQLAGTYVFASAADYDQFETQARALGLDEKYAVTSSDIESYEQSLVPLENLSDFALYFLLIVLAIGSIVLIVLNIFNIRERKYEIGVLAAIGMKKAKIALQYVSELCIVTFAAIIIGTGIGAVVSVPVTNNLLSSQVSAQQSQSENRQANFGRPNENGQTGTPPQMTGGEKGGFFSPATSYLTEVSSATDLTVVLELIGIGALLTIISGAAALVFILRYEPLKILSNRD